MQPLSRFCVTVRHCPSVKKSVVTNRSQNIRLAVLETVIYHLPLWRFVIYVSVVCLFSGKLRLRRQMLLLPRPGANKGRENGMIPLVILFFFINIFLFLECSLDEVRMTLQSDCISTGTKTLTAVNIQNIIQFYPRAACFFCLCRCFSPVKSSRRRYSRCFGRHLTCQVVSFGMFIISF